MKRLFDIFFSFIGIVILSPIIFAIFIAIRLYDNGPVFYKAPRVGRNGIIFKMIKFRTMTINADKTGASSTKADDPRITKPGSILRNYKLDEIPQLFNVLFGEMSIVGPRPQIKWAVDLYTPEEKQILTVRPGITDYASIKFNNEGEILKGSDDPDKLYMEIIHPEKMRLSLEYVKNKSIFTDIKIIFLTILSFFKK
ncbi:MAG: sugar transferase [Bacteroidetes bacterium]|nr:MAG: sugar transferase [Bacteroidota bacterium]